MEYKLENSVNHRVAILATLLKRQIYRIIAANKLEITPDQWVILYNLWQENGLTVGEIASRTNKDFANATRIVDKLEKMGYVSKEKNHKDNRSTHVYILPKSDYVKEKIILCWIEATEVALTGIDENEQQALLNTISKIESNVLEYLNK